MKDHNLIQSEINFEKLKLETKKQNKKLEKIILNLTSDQKALLLESCIRDRDEALKKFNLLEEQYQNKQINGIAS